MENSAASIARRGCGSVVSSQLYETGFSSKRSKKMEVVLASIRRLAAGTAATEDTGHVAANSSAADHGGGHAYVCNIYLHDAC